MPAVMKTLRPRQRSALPGLASTWALKAAAVSSRHTRAAETFMVEGVNVSFGLRGAGFRIGLDLSAPLAALAILSAFYRRQRAWPAS